MANELDEPDPPVIVTTVPTDAPVEEVRPHPSEWYGTAEFRRLLMEHFTAAVRKAVASNPPDMPG